MSRAARYVVGLLALALLVITLPATRAVLAAYLIEPIAISLWAAWRVIASVNQGVYWLLLIVLCALLTIRVFSVRGGGTIEAEESTASAPLDPLERWQALFQKAGESDETDEALRVSLRNLAMKLIAQPGAGASGNLSEALQSAHISLPPDVEGYLLSNDTDGARDPGLAAWLTRLLHPRTGKEARRQDRKIDAVLQWMEAEVEINHDET